MEFSQVSWESMFSHIQVLSAVVSNNLIREASGETSSVTVNLAVEVSEVRVEARESFELPGSSLVGKLSPK